MDSGARTKITPLEDITAESSKAGETCLVVLRTPDVHEFGRRYVLTHAPFTVGRSRSNTLVLNYDAVSRRHLRVENRGSRWAVVDLDSTNGCYVNDEQVGDYLLQHGDHLKVGATLLKFVCGTNAEARYHATLELMLETVRHPSVRNGRLLPD